MLRLTHVFIIQLCIALTLFCQPLASHADPGDRFSESVDSMFSTWMRDDAPGMLVSVSYQGRMLYEKGFGMANLEYNIPISNASVFDIASISKQFTGFAIASLIEEGKISIDDNIRKYLPEMNLDGQVTIRHLLHHMSGIRDSPAMFELSGIRIDDVLTFDRLLTYAFNQRTLNFIPGSEFVYSNTGYNLLAEIVQRVTGQSFREWIEEHIFNPLKMTHSHVHDNYQEVIKNRSSSYSIGSGNRYQLQTNNLCGLGASSIFTTAEDLQKWCQFLMHPDDDNKPIITLMSQVGELNSGQKTPYGFGIGVAKYRGTERKAHSGQWASFNSTLQCYPAYDLSIVILSNTDVVPEPWAQQIADLILLDQEIENLDSPIGTSHNYIQIAGPDLDKYCGDYMNSNQGIERKILRRGDTLVYARSEGSENNLLPISKTKFVMQDVPVDIIIEFNDEKNVDSMEIGIDNSDFLALKLVQPFTCTEEQVATCIGTYYNENLEVQYSFTIENGELVARHISGNTVRFTCIAEDIFRGDQRYLTQIKIVRNSDGTVAGILVNNFRNRNIYFRKI